MLFSGSKSRLCFVPSSLLLASKSPLDYQALLDHLPALSDLGVSYNSDVYKLSPLVELILKLLVLYSCRVSELLSIKCSQIISGDRIVVSPSKNSRSYMIFVPSLSTVFNAENGFESDDYIFRITYSKVVSQLKRSGVGVTRAKSQNRKITHIGRYLLIDELEEKQLIEHGSDLLHHNSDKSLSYYQNRERS